MTTAAKVRLIRDAFRRAESFSGWGNFGIEVRSLGPRLPWNYDALAKAAVAESSAVLDLATGGGERLLAIAGGMQHGQIVATEAWHVNAPIAARALAPFGISVVRCTSAEAGTLPFPDAAFDLVLNRHGGIDAREIDRVLRQGGRFLTQQIDPGDWPELRKHFPRVTEWPANHHERRAEEFRALGHTVASQRHDYRVAYGSIADLTFNLAATPWTIPGFSFERDCDALLALDAEQTTEEGLIMTRALNLVLATKR